MRKPTPVIINKNIDESWSTWKAKSILKEEIFINGNKGCTGNAPPDLTSKNKIQLIINEIRIVPQPIILTRLLDKFLNSPFRKKPSKGKSGMR